MKAMSQMVLTISIYVLGCSNGANLVGKNEVPSEAPQMSEQDRNSQNGDGLNDSDLERELDSMPPELIGGTYLTEMRCGRIQTKENILPDHLAVCGCGFYRKDNNQPVIVGRLQQHWTLKSQGRIIDHQLLEIPANSRIAAAFVVRESDLQSGVSMEVSMADKNGQSVQYASEWQKGPSPFGTINIFNNSGQMTINL